jgi:hypothetical protein
LREAITGFLNPCAGKPIKVRAVVIDLVVCYSEIRPNCPGVCADACPEVVSDFVVSDRDVLILVRDFDPVGGEFSKRPEFLSFLSLIPSSACATFSLFFCMRSSSLSDLVDLAGSVPWLPNPSCCDTKS